jgi:hypothetical protein
MAVTIDEMHVEVQEPALPAAASTSDDKTKKEIDLRSALELLRERKLRLRAD